MIFQVLIHGTEEATSCLAEFCHSTGVVQSNVFCPSVGDVIDATTERQIYQVTCVLRFLFTMKLTSVSHSLSMMILLSRFIHLVAFLSNMSFSLTGLLIFILAFLSLSCVISVFFDINLLIITCILQAFMCVCIV